LARSWRRRGKAWGRFGRVVEAHSHSRGRLGKVVATTFKSPERLSDIVATTRESLRRLRGGRGDDPGKPQEALLDRGDDPKGFRVGGGDRPSDGRLGARGCGSCGSIYGLGR
jgi:hypothetical protein